MAIEKGKIVWLKSGGPAMTIKCEWDDGTWMCTWFVEDKIFEHEFSEEQLTEEEPD